MKFSDLIVDFIITFVIIFLAGVVVTFLYNLLVHDQSTVEWATSIRLALILGITLPWLRSREKAKKINR